MSEKMLKALKIFIIVAGILIMAGFLMVGLELYRRVNIQEETVDPSSFTPFVHGLNLPPGTQFFDAGVTPDTYILRAVLPGGEQRIFFIRTTDGLLITTLHSGSVP